MVIFTEIWVWIRKYILRKKERTVVAITPTEVIREVEIPRPIHRPKKAIHQDVGRFMAGKGRGQHKWYRISVKAKKKPEGDEN